jgi:YggT family protein
MEVEMFVLSNLLIAVAKILDIALSLYMWIIIIRAIVSWVNPDPFNPIVRFLSAITDPVLYAIRKRIPISFGAFDLSPILVIFAIIFLQTFLVNSLMQLALRMAR